MSYSLSRRDLLELEPRLCADFARVLPFDAHAVYFPLETRTQEPEWLADEKKLLIPLVREEQLLGVFMCHVDDESRVLSVLPALSGFSAVCLDNLALYKAGQLESLTGLMTREVLLERLRQEMEGVQASFARGFSGGEDLRGLGGNIGLIVISFDGLREIVRSVGYGFADRLVLAMAEAFRDGLPGQVAGARSGDTAFAVLLPGATRIECEKLAISLVARMEQVCLQESLTGRRFSILPCAGYAFFPQDMDGAHPRELREQPRVLLHKAELAADIVRSLPAGLRPVRMLGYNRLLAEGGHVQRVYPLSRVLINLGRGVGAREGQRFSVWSIKYAAQRGNRDEEQPLYKGEVVLLEVRESESVAEVLHLGDPAWALEQGDVLTFIDDATVPPGAEWNSGVSHRPDPLTGLLRHGDFLACLAQKSKTDASFGLALVHVDFRNSQSSLAEFNPEHVLRQVAALCRRAFPEKEGGVPGGRFGLNSLIFYHTGQQSPALETLYTQICEEAGSELGVRLGVGIACWPFLQFRHADILECARKALGYALMLPPPQVGVFGSLAMNISADHLHCRGDIFGAIEEYKLALLADQDNALAWNSLGVCLATLGRHAEARGYFEEALKRGPDDSMLNYNLGAVCQTLNDPAAEGFFLECLRLSPNNLYALVRLGQLAEAAEDVDKARAYYTKAAGCEETSSLPYRHLARLAMQEKKMDEAREHLHQALLRNPQDAAALSLMASLYLDGGEDPELAESLARQSVLQRPEYHNGWLVLAKALEVLGRPEEARQALMKSGEA